MTCTLLTLALVVTPAQAKPHPLAPSLPLLTKEEYAEIRQVIDRFILYDIGKLTGPEGRKALEDFQALGPEAIPILIEGFNKAATMAASCPCVLIGRKLSKLLAASEDVQLLTYAKEAIGLGDIARRHQGTVSDLKLGIQLRRTQVQQKLAAMRSLSVDQLADAARRERGQSLRSVLTELERRDGPQVLDTLGTVAGQGDPAMRDFARGLIAKHLWRQKPELLKGILKDGKTEVRLAAIKVVGDKKLRFGGELIAILEESDTKLQQAARQALILLSGGADYGPLPDASAEDRAVAVRRWREWWAGK